MGPFTAGQVVLVNFPFSDLSGSKFRPAVVLADAGRGDWVLCQVTSSAYGDSRAIPLEANDFASGSLHRSSLARPGKLFTANSTLIATEVGVLSSVKLGELREAVIQLIQAG